MPNNPITPTNEARTNGTVIDASHTNDLASALNRLVGITSTVSSAGTLTLLVGSMRTQQITGTTTHTVVLPVVSTLGLGFPFRVINDSTGIVTVNSSGGNLIYAIPAGTTVDFICILLTGTTAASWLADYPAAASGAAVYGKTLSAGANKTTTSTSYVAIDSTNLRITATPASTIATIVCTGFLSMSGVTSHDWRINCGSGTTYGYAAYNSSYDSTAENVVTIVFVITGLTAGVSYDFDWEWKVNAGTATLIGDTATVYPRMAVTC